MAAQPPQLSAEKAAFEFAAHEFAEELSDTVQAVAGQDCRRFEAVVTHDPPDAYISQEERAGIPLTRDGDTILRLDVSIKLTTDHTGGFLRVHTSQFRVFVEGGTLPVFRYEYELAKEGSAQPAAHMQFHGSHPDLERLMVRAGRTSSRSSRPSGGPNVTDLHMPVGGTRFRPCLEDVLEFLINEFGIDPLPDRLSALSALADGRREWRRKQLRTAIRDNPGEAASQLLAMGYNLVWSKAGPAPHARDEHLRSI